MAARRRLSPVALPLALALAACAGHASAPPCAGRTVASAPPSATPAPASDPAAPRAVRPAPSATPVPPPPGPGTAPAVPEGFAATVARLAREAPGDADLSGHADLLAAIAAATTAPAEATRIERLPALEAAERARLGRGTGWATLTTYVAPGADADALRRAYLDYDRLPAWTGRPGTRTLGREGDVVLGFADGIRSALGFRFGARWAFRARPVDRGASRLVVTRQTEAPGTEGMLATRTLLVIVPEAGGVRVAEAAASVLAMEVPAVLRSFAESAAHRELLARTDGIRAHWREYVK